MSLFVILCLLSRLAYSLNDIFTGRLARELGRMEVAGWRGVSLGITMAPLLFWVPREAWSLLGHRWVTLLACVALTATCNMLQMQAARNLPFGLRAAFIMAGMAGGSTMLGWYWLGDRLGTMEIVLSVVVIGSSIAAAFGTHANHEIEPQIRRGFLFAGTASILMAVVAVLMADLARTTHPLLTAWAWEFGAGLIFVVPLLVQFKAIPAGQFGRRFIRIATAALPTVAGSGMSAVALSMGAIGIWAAIAGTQVLFTAGFGVIWHQEKVGPLRWTCFGLAAAAVAGLAVAR